MRKALWLATCWFLFLGSAQSQNQVFTDDFSDLNFSANPTWVGETGNFKIDSANQRLQLFAPAVSDESHLVTTSNAIENGIWEFRVFMDFNPSSSNRALVYLVSDQANLEDPLNGYYVMLGNTSDEVSLYRQDGTSSSEIIDGADDLLDVSAPEVLVRVTRDSVGNWELLTDTSLSATYQLQGTATDTTHLNAAYFGVFCDYTSTRSDKFFFDDFSVSGTPISDKDAPELDSLNVVSNNQLQLFFNETLDPTAAQAISNYSVSPGIGNPNSAVLSGGGQEVTLSFATPFTNGNSYTLSLSGIADTSGNSIAPQNKPFVYFVPVPPDFQDVVINEFMADPTPPSSLPNLEFIELWNYSNKTFDLANWQIGDNSNFATLPSFILQPFQFVILCDDGDTSFFAPYGDVLGVNGLPALNNSGDQVRLRNDAGSTVDSLEYDVSWYDDDLKENGGFSLELISPRDPCKNNAENYIAAVTLDGGTPGKLNSAFDTVPDPTPPQVVDYQVGGLDTLTLTFSKKMDSTSLATANYTIAGLSASVISISTDIDQVTLLLSQSLSLGTSYELSVTGTEDCYGIAQQAIVIPFGKGRAPQPFELLITELYPDPDATVSPLLPEYEFVELYNTTDAIISLSGGSISDPGNTQPLGDLNLQPGEYAIMVERGNGFGFLPFGNVVEINELPSLNNTGDRIQLRSNSGQLIHSVNYDSDWYKDETKSEGGFTLEMIDLSNPCGSKENWKASEASEGGTPGQPNSVSASNPDEEAPMVVSVFAVNSFQLVVNFSETIDSGSVSSAGLLFTPEITVDSVILNAPDQLTITLSEPLIAKQAYTLSLSGLTDCVGNEVEFSETLFGLPEPYETGEVVINEVLSNPRPSSGTDYIELINVSEKFISLQGWRFADYDQEDDTLGTVRFISEEPFTLNPGQILAFSENTRELVEEYANTVEENCIELEDLPALSNDEDRVIVLDDTGAFVDDFSYHEDLHLAIINDLNGVALERINPRRPTDDPTNWSSAAANENYGTPGFENSVFQTEIATEEAVTLSPELFSPDNDGYNDVLNIQYQLDSPDYIGTVTVFNARGEREIILLNNKTLGSSGTVTWDGINDQNLKAQIGIYVVVVELYDLEGNTKTYKKTCVLGGKL